MLGGRNPFFIQSVQFTACGLVFHQLTKKNYPTQELTTAECQALIGLSSFLLDALSWHWNCKVRGLPDAVVFVREQYSNHLLRTVAELKDYFEYWQFINRMRQVVLSLGFRRLPRFATVMELNRMAGWCFEAGHKKLQMFEPPALY
jgi:hypothetical protein